LVWKKFKFSAGIFKKLKTSGHFDGASFLEVEVVYKTISIGIDLLKSQFKIKISKTYIDRFDCSTEEILILIGFQHFEYYEESTAYLSTVK